MSDVDRTTEGCVKMRLLPEAFDFIAPSTASGGWARLYRLAVSFWSNVG